MRLLFGKCMFLALNGVWSCVCPANAESKTDPSLLDSLIQAEEKARVLYLKLQSIRDIKHAVEGVAHTCMERRCLLKGDIKVELEASSAQSKKKLQVSIAGSRTTLDLAETSSAILNFRGDMSLSASYSPSKCDYSLSNITIFPTHSSKGITLKKVTFKMREGSEGDVSWKVFFTRNYRKVLSTGDSVTISYYQDIRNSKEFKEARLSSCAY